MSKSAKEWAARQAIANGPMKSVLNELAYMHRDGRDLFPSQQLLADTCGVNARTVREALWLLEHFGVVQRRRRSRGAAGRTSDAFLLALVHEFTLTPTVVRAAKATLRKCSSNRHRAPVAERLLPEPRSGASGAALQGIGDYQKEEPVQEEVITDLEVSDTHEGQAVGGGLRVIAGGRS